MRRHPRGARIPPGLEHRTVAVDAYAQSGRKLFIPHPVRGGAMPARHSGYTTGGIPLPQGIRYDPLGFAGLGAESETPDIKVLPWRIKEDGPPSATELKRERRQERWGRFEWVLGLTGGILGVVLSLKALGYLGKGRR